MTQTKQCIEWIKNYYKDNPDGKAIIGISGGKDSTIAAALCVEALGADRVIGVLMPNGGQHDINDSEEVCRVLDIRGLKVNILRAFTAICDQIDYNYGYTLGSTAHNDMINQPPRSPSYGYAVCGCRALPQLPCSKYCNRSEDYVGYSTKFGDAAGDFSPLGNLTVREVLAIGDELGLPEHLVHKAPSDGMCGKTDEDNLGFTYNELDDFLLGTGDISEETYNKIERLHTMTRHKYEPMPMFSPVNYDGILGQMSIYDLPTFDYTKQQKRGLRAESGIIMDECPTGGLVDNVNMQGNIGTFTIDPLYHSTPNYDGIDLEKLAETMQKVIDTAGCGILKERK